MEREEHESSDEDCGLQRSGVGIVPGGAAGSRARSAGNGHGHGNHSSWRIEYIGQQVASGSRAPMYGANSGLTVGFWRKFGVRFDLGYARANNLFGTGHDSDILSYMVGPTFYPVRTERLSPYVELLAGGARVTSVTLNGPDSYIRGYANEFAWAGGGGLEFRASPEFAVRVGADYMYTRYFGPSTALTGQGNIRAVMSFTYHLGVRRR